MTEHEYFKRVVRAGYMLTPSDPDRSNLAFDMIGKFWEAGIPLSLIFHVFATIQKKIFWHYFWPVMRFFSVYRALATGRHDETLETTEKSEFHRRIVDSRPELAPAFTGTLTDDELIELFHLDEEFRLKSEIWRMENGEGGLKCFQTHYLKTKYKIEDLHGL